MRRGLRRTVVLGQDVRRTVLRRTVVCTPPYCRATVLFVSDLFPFTDLQTVFNQAKLVKLRTIYFKTATLYLLLLML